MSDLRVAIVGDDGEVRRIVERAGGAVVTARAADGGVDPDADVLVTVGERAFVDAALAGGDAPLLPVDAGAGRHAVRPADLGGVVDALASGGGRTVDHPLLSIRADDERVARALLDASLVASEPASISEYSVHGRGGRLARFRADGVVVATPAGSAGYAHAAGGPVLAPGTGLAVVPVSPFATRADVRVVDGAVRLRVERDEIEVSLVADDRVVRTVPPGTTVEVAAEGSVAVVDADPAD